jgi:peroxiredoxin
MGPAARRVDVVAVTTDPEEDTPAAARWFSSQHGLLHRWHYLLGTRAQLAPIWHAYYIYAAPPNAPASVKDAHTGATYLIDTQGRERVLMGGAPDTATLVRDLQILSGLMPNSTGESAVPAPQGGHPAPDFTLPALDGSAVHLSGLRNRVVLLNFWATWCTPCRSEMPMLANWYRQLHGQHFVILGVDQQQSAAQARSFAQKYHIPYPILLDQSGAISAQYDVVGLPTSLLIDRNGVVESVKAGILNKSYLSIVVQPFLRGHPGER